MFEVLSIISGALILLLYVGMFSILWDDTDKFGTILGMAGLIGILVAVCYFGVVVNNYLYFGFAGMTAIIFFAIIPINLARYIKKKIRLTFRRFDDIQKRGG